MSNEKFFGVRVIGKKMPLPVMFESWADANMSRLTHKVYNADEMEVLEITMCSVPTKRNGG